MADAPEKPDPGKRGKGELLQDPRHLRGDLGLIERSLSDGYPIQPGQRQEWIDEANYMATAKKDGKYVYRARVRIAALRVIERFDRTNLDRARILAGIAAKDEGGYQPTELHKHEHLHLESAEAPAPVQIEVHLVEDWYGTPDVLPAKKNGKKRANKNGRAKKNGKPKK